jgi:hypothetical protein
MRRKLLIALLLVIFSPSFGLTPVGADAGAVNLTGTWGLQYMPSRGTGGPIKMTFVFKQEGEKLSGTFSGVGPVPSCPVIGAVKGNDVVFGWEMPGNRGTTQTVAFKGTIESATKMTGTVRDPFCGGGEGCKWTATRKNRKARNSAVPAPASGQSPKPGPRRSERE